MEYQHPDYALCKYLGEYINLKLNIRWNASFHPEDVNRIIDARIRLYDDRRYRRLDYIDDK